MFQLILLTVFLTAAYADSLLQLDGRIVGGNETTISAYPYQVSLRRYGHHNCGGAIYKPNIIITAGHCVAGASTIGFTVVAGTSFRLSGGTAIPVKTINLHPNYDYMTNSNDIALLILSNDFSYSEVIQPIQLPLQGEQITEGDEAIVTGWGATEEGGYGTNTLQYVSVNIVSNEECGKDYGKQNINPSMICAGTENGEHDACQGDSGGPLAMQSKLIGIVSWGNGCARKGYPGVYTRVADFRNWIESEVENLNVN